MNYQELIKNRYSVRMYTSEAIADDELAPILEAVRLAPSARNQQPVKVRVVRSMEVLAKIDTITKYRYKAPCVLVFSYDKTGDFKNPYESGCRSGEQDVSIAATQAMLAATDAGLGSCWVGDFAPSATREALGLPENEEVVMMLLVGHPSEKSHPIAWHSQSKPIEDMVSYL